MQAMRTFSSFFFGATSMVLVAMVFHSCKKEEQVVFSDNTIPAYNEIPTILVENYVNRVYIDLIGREPTDIEMAGDVQLLESAELSVNARKALSDKLMFSTVFIEGDSSYKQAFYTKFYNDTKARLLEGISEASLDETYSIYYFNALQDSLNGNIPAYELGMIEANKLKDIIDSRVDLSSEVITVNEMYRRMMFNAVYDEINMNTFNFINASFDNLFFRYPTDAEFEQAYAPIEYNGSGIIFGQVVSNKPEYLDVLTSSSEYKEGMIRWAYLQLLSRDALTGEVYNRMDMMNDGYNINAVIQSILITDEYAGFD